MAQWENTVLRRGIPGATKFSQQHPEFSCNDLCVFVKWRIGHNPTTSFLSKPNCLFFGYPLRIQAQPLRKKCKIVDFFNVIKKLVLNEHFCLQLFSKEILLLERRGAITYRFPQANTTCIFTPNCDKFTLGLVH